MQRATTRNFLLGGMVLLVIMGLAVYAGLGNRGCEPDGETVVAVVDFTDPLGDDARATLKDRVWEAITRAADHSNVVLRAILGVNKSGKLLTIPPKVLCRPERPSATTGLRGPTRPVEDRWLAFEDQVCGLAPRDPTTPHRPPPACGDPARRGSFFELQPEKSYSSPIAEEILDAARRHLPPNVKRWHLIVASDWREYMPGKVDLETRKCDPQVDPHRVESLLLVGPREKLLAEGDDAGGKNVIDSYLIQRSDMTQAEADCLQSVAEAFFRLNMASPPPGLNTWRLSVTQR